jgi:hypothetical protein
MPHQHGPSAEVILDRLEVQLATSARPALRRLARAARGKSDFRNDAELRACVALAKAAGEILYVRRGGKRSSRSAFGF